MKNTVALIVFLVLLFCVVPAFAEPTYNVREADYHCRKMCMGYNHKDYDTIFYPVSIRLDKATPHTEEFYGTYFVACRTKDGPRTVDFPCWCTARPEGNQWFIEVKF